jgi:hypothetical protein
MLPRLLAVALAVLAVLVSFPVNVISSYFPEAVTDHRLVWAGGLLAALVVIGVIAWLAGDVCCLADS